jgi:hypothetical protein
MGWAGAAISSGSILAGDRTECKRRLLSGPCCGETAAAASGNRSGFLFHFRTLLDTGIEHENIIRYRTLRWKSRTGTAITVV